MVQDIAIAGADILEPMLPVSIGMRWTPWRKAAVVLGVRQGSISVDEACDRYMLSREELANWDRAYDRHGVAGLHSKTQQWRRGA
jgi:transposase-like protein